LTTNHTHRTMLKIGLIAAWMVIILACAHLNAADATSVNPLKKQLGDLDLRSPTGEQVSLIPYITHRAVVIVFWAAWCPICRAEAERINELNKDPGVKVLAVNEGDAPQQIKDFVAAYRVGYQIVVDPTSDLAKAFGVPGMPYCVVIGRSGTIVHRGYRLPENLDYYVK